MRRWRYVRMASKCDPLLDNVLLLPTAGCMHLDWRKGSSYLALQNCRNQNYNQISKMKKKTLSFKQVIQ